MQEWKSECDDELQLALLAAVTLSRGVTFYSLKNGSDQKNGHKLVTSAEFEPISGKTLSTGCTVFCLSYLTTTDN
jgi:hypothetical protein